MLGFGAAKRDKQRQKRRPQILERPFGPHYFEIDADKKAGCVSPIKSGFGSFIHLTHPSGFAALAFRVG
jgi:hypothetical protein